MAAQSARLPFSAGAMLNEGIIDDSDEEPDISHEDALFEASQIMAEAEAWCKRRAEAARLIAGLGDHIAALEHSQSARLSKFPHERSRHLR